MKYITIPHKIIMKIKGINIKYLEYILIHGNINKSIKWSCLIQYFLQFIDEETKD